MTTTEKEAAGLGMEAPRIEIKDSKVTPTGVRARCMATWRNVDFAKPTDLRAIWRAQMDLAKTFEREWGPGVILAVSISRIDNDLRMIVAFHTVKADKMPEVSGASLLQQFRDAGTEVMAPELQPPGKRRIQMKE